MSLIMINYEILLFFLFRSPDNSSALSQKERPEPGVSDRAMGEFMLSKSLIKYLMIDQSLQNGGKFEEAPYFLSISSQFRSIPKLEPGNFVEIPIPLLSIYYIIKTKSKKLSHARSTPSILVFSGYNDAN